MIGKLHIKNFKSLKDIILDLKGLNLMMGLNGMGKSSVIQALLILRQSRDLTNGIIDLNGMFTEIGVGRDALYQFNNLEENIQFQVDLITGESFKWNLDYQPENQHLETRDLYEKNKLATCSLFNQNFQYLKAERTPPLDIYKTSSLEVITNGQLGIDGCYTAHFLSEFGNYIVPDSLLHANGKTKILIHQVNAWLGEITPGTKLETYESSGFERVVLEFQFETKKGYTNHFKPKNVGFGLSYVLPVIVALLCATPGRLIIIENPEAHIHPKGQAELGKLMALAALAGAQLIVETHSDHILNGIRVAVKERPESRKGVNLFYFERITTEEEQYSKVTPVTISKGGELSDYPKDMLDEWSNQLIKLI